MPEPVRQTRNPDYWLLLTVAALTISGLVMVFSASFAVSYYYYQTPYRFFALQLAYAALGSVGLLVAVRVDYHRWQKVSLVFMLAALGLLVLVLAKGVEINGARRWLYFGPQSVQPAEIMKLALVVYLADWLGRKGEEVKHVIYGFVPFALLVGLIAGLIVRQPDFGTTILMVLVAFGIFFVSGAHLVQLGLGALFGGGVLAFLAVSAPYRAARFLGFWNPWESEIYRETGYQVRQALLALGSGGITGLGFGFGRQKYFWLPMAHTDAIFAVIGEELGLIGCLAVIALFAILAFRGYRVAAQAPDRFGFLLAAGITSWFVVQALINLGGITATIPFTGIPLPFISYGGSSLVISLTGAGILLSVSRQTHRLGRMKSAPVDLGWWHGGARLPRLGRRQSTAKR